MAEYYIMIKSNLINQYLVSLTEFMKTNDERLTTLNTILIEKASQNHQDIDFANFVNKIRLIQSHAQLVELVYSNKYDLKRLCIKFKHIDSQYIRQLSKSGVCWKYIIHLLKAFDKIMNHELSWPFKNFEAFGDVEFCEVFSSRILLLVSTF